MDAGPGAAPVVAAPTYNILLIALDKEGDTEYAGIIWPAEATLDAFRVVLTGDYWYLQHFWLKFANSLFVALATMLITLAIGSLAAFAFGRMKLARGWLFGNFPVSPMLSRRPSW